MSEYIVDGFLLGVFGLVCVAAGDAVHKRDWVTIAFNLGFMAILAPMILRSMAADHFKTGTTGCVREPRSGEASPSQTPSLTETK